MKTREMTIYLSGPMTGHDDFNYAAFNAAARTLRSQGYTVINPAENDNGDTTKPREHYMRQDIRHVTNADAVAVLPGWRNSKGARLEVDVARELKMPVLDVKTLKEIPDEPNALEEADRIVNGPRRETYGHPKANHTRTAQMWSAYLGIDITPRQVCMLNTLQKISRDAHAPKRDNLVDIAGYTLNAEIVSDAEV